MNKNTFRSSMFNFPFTKTYVLWQNKTKKEVFLKKPFFMYSSLYVMYRDISGIKYFLTHGILILISPLPQAPQKPELIVQLSWKAKY